MSRGRILQAAAYALSGSQLEVGIDTAGRYLQLGVDTPDRARIVEVESGDRECLEEFERSVRVAVEAWDRGSLTPRLVDASNGREPRHCQRCEVKEACLRGDSGSRVRLESWVEAASSGDSAKPLEAERAALDLWNLGVSGT